MELSRQLTWSRQRAELYHYRTRDNVEVDLILENRRGQVVAIEVKASSTVKGEDFRGLRHLADRLGDDLLAGIVLSRASDPPVRPQIPRHARRRDPGGVPGRERMTTCASLVSGGVNRVEGRVVVLGEWSRSGRDTGWQRCGSSSGTNPTAGRTMAPARLMRTRLAMRTPRPTPVTRAGGAGGARRLRPRSTRRTAPEWTPCSGLMRSTRPTTGSGRSRAVPCQSPSTKRRAGSPVLPSTGRSLMSPTVPATEQRHPRPPTGRRTMPGSSMPMLIRCVRLDPHQRPIRLSSRRPWRGSRAQALR